MDQVLIPFLKVFLFCLSGYKVALITYALLSWLYLFGVVRPDNQLIGVLMGFLQRIIEPFLIPLRTIIPSPAGLDLSFFVLFIATHMLSGIVGLYLNQLTLEATFLS